MINKRTNNSKGGFAVIPLIIAVVVVAGLAGYLVLGKKFVKGPQNLQLQSTSTVSAVDATADWQMYRSEQYGFEIKRPRSWNQEVTRDLTILKLVDRPSDVIHPDANKLQNSFDISGIYRTTCQNSDWTNNLGSINKTVCRPDLKITINMKATSLEAQKLEDQILSTFKFIEPAITSWKTYSNDKYGFEFKYPSGWAVAETKNTIKLAPPPGSGASTVTFSVSPISKGMAPNINCQPVGGEDINSIVDGFHSAECKNLENANGVRYARGINSGMSTEQTYKSQTLSGYFLNSQESVIVRTILTDTAGNTFPSTTLVFDQILFTFRFIEPTVDTSNWKTYRDEQYEFEFKYPEDKFVLATTSVHIWQLGDPSGAGLVNREEYEKILPKLGKEECPPSEAAGGGPLVKCRFQFAVSFVVLDKNIENIRQTQKELGNQLDFSVGDKNGFEIQTGSEWGGANYYFIPIDNNKTLLLTRNTKYGSGGPPEPPSEAFSDIIQTLKFK